MPKLSTPSSRRTLWNISAPRFSSAKATSGLPSVIGAGPELVAQLGAADLAADRLRELVDEVDLTRVLVGSGEALGEVLELLGELGVALAAGSEDDEGADDLGSLGVVFADHRRLHHGLVLDQCRLDLEGADPVGGGGDHVVVAALEPEVAVAVAPGFVAA